MRLEIKFDQKINPVLYEEYSRFIYGKMLQTIRYYVRRNRKRYRVRESLILVSPLIKWKKSPPSRVNLLYYLENCIELKRVKGTYVIELNDRWLVRGSLTKVKTLVRILEYGTSKIPPLPLIRSIFLYYAQNYDKLFIKFMEERLL